MRPTSARWTSAFTRPPSDPDLRAIGVRTGLAGTSRARRRSRRRPTDGPGSSSPSGTRPCGPGRASGGARSPAIDAGGGSGRPRCVRDGGRPRPYAGAGTARARSRHRAVRPAHGGPHGRPDGCRPRSGCALHEGAALSRARGPGRSARPSLAAPLVADGQAVATLLPPAGEHLPARLRLHAGTEAVIADSLPVAGLSVCRLHRSLGLWASRAGTAPGSRASPVSGRALEASGEGAECQTRSGGTRGVGFLAAVPGRLRPGARPVR